MNKRLVLWILLAAFVMGMVGCSKETIPSPLLPSPTTPSPISPLSIVYFKNEEQLIYRKDYEDAQEEYLIASFYNNNFFLDSDVTMDSENGYLYYNVPTEGLYGNLYRVDINTLMKDQENPGELVEENVVRTYLRLAGRGVLFQKYENEVWSLYYSYPGEEPRQILDGDVVKYYINDEDVYLVEKVSADEHAADRLNLWSYNIKTGEKKEIEQNVYEVMNGKCETQILCYLTREDNGIAYFGIRKNGEINRYVDGVKTYEDESDDKKINILFLRKTADDKFVLYQYDGTSENLIDTDVKREYIFEDFGYTKDGQLYVYVKNTFLRVSSDIDLEDKERVWIRHIFENGALLIEYENRFTENNDHYRYNYAIWNVMDGEIVEEKVLATGCDGKSEVIVDSSLEEENVFLYANTDERSFMHQLSMVDEEGNLRVIDTYFNQGYIDGMDIYSLKDGGISDKLEIPYETLYSHGRVERYENLSELSLIHVSEDLIEENTLAVDVEQIVFAENGVVFYISKDDLFREDHGENVRMCSNVSYIWTLEKSLKEVGGEILDTKRHGDRY